MKKLNAFKYITTFSALLFFTSFVIAGGGGGTTPDLGTKQGLKRAADDFLTAFVYLSKVKDTHLTPLNHGVEGFKNFGVLIDVVRYEYGTSLFEVAIHSPWLTNLPRPKNISREERQTFLNDYLKQQEEKFSFKGTNSIAKN